MFNQFKLISITAWYSGRWRGHFWSHPCRALKPHWWLHWSQDWKRNRACIISEYGLDSLNGFGLFVFFRSRSHFSFLFQSQWLLIPRKNIPPILWVYEACTIDDFWFSNSKFILFFSNCSKDQVSEAAKDKTVSEWLWKVSERWTGLDGSSEPN